MVSGGRDGQRNEKQASPCLSDFYVAEQRCGTPSSARRRSPCARKDHTSVPDRSLHRPSSPLTTTIPIPICSQFSPCVTFNTVELDFRLIQAPQSMDPEVDCHWNGVHMFRFVLVPVPSISGLHPSPPSQYSIGRAEKSVLSYFHPRGSIQSRGPSVRRLQSPPCAHPAFWVIPISSYTASGSFSTLGRTYMNASLNSSCKLSRSSSIHLFAHAFPIHSLFPCTGGPQSRSLNPCLARLLLNLRHPRIRHSTCTRHRTREFPRPVAKNIWYVQIIFSIQIYLSVESRFNLCRCEKYSYEFAWNVYLQFDDGALSTLRDF